MTQQTYGRLLLDRKLKEFGIHPSSEAVAKSREHAPPAPQSNLSSPAAVMKQSSEPKASAWMMSSGTFVTTWNSRTHLNYRAKWQLVTLAEAKGL